MYGNSLRAPKVDIHDFTMIPRADVPRSSFRMQHQHKTTIQTSILTPVHLQEILPGDSFNVTMSVFARLATPLYPIMDNLTLESFFFFVPCRLVWKNWYKFQGEQDNPTDSISFAVPQIVSPASGFAQLSIYDYFGLPTVGQTGAGAQISINALPLRAYGLIYNQWFRDENLSTSFGFGTTDTVGYNSMDDGPDPYTNYVLNRVAKRHDYFTSCLPWTQKSTNPITIPLDTSAPIKTSSVNQATGAAGVISMRFANADGSALTTNRALTIDGAGNARESTTVTSGFATTIGLIPQNLYADLSSATAATINQLRLSFQTQRLLERDARGGTRYTEIIRSHFGVISPDARLQRPEYLGGGKTPVNIAPVPQTTATGVTGGATPLGTLSAAGTAMGSHGFRQAFTEHGYVLGLVCVRADQVYQQGIRKLWSRSTRYDFYMPVFAMLGEQAVLNKEIYSDGGSNDALVFGYQERWAEYRFHPSFTSAYFRSTTTTPLDAWHLGIKFTGLPALNNAFIQDKTSDVVTRAVAAGSQADFQQLLCDFFFDEKAARPMPMYSVPGLIDHL